MASAAECGWVLGALRHALAWLGLTGQGTGDARSLLPRRGAQGLPVSATKSASFSSSVKQWQCLTARIDNDLTAKS